MKRLRIELADLAARDNLTLAQWKAAQGRTRQRAVARWLADADRHLNLLAADIRCGAAPSHQVRRFAIHDPKRRTITAPCFADRVLHHAILNLAEARFEGALVASSWACHPGRGVHRSVTAVQQALRRWPWFVQVDVASYFERIDHQRLLDLLARRFKGADFLALLERIVRGAPALPHPGRGLPIGALTSQHFANAYLDGADRWLLAHPAVQAHARYMDDSVWWCRSRAEGDTVLAELQGWMQQELGLELKPGAHARSSDQGLLWCGFVVQRGAVLPGPRKRQRFAAGVQRLQAAECWADAAALQRAHDALLATLAHTDSLAWRRALWHGPAAGETDALA